MATAQNTPTPRTQRFLLPLASLLFVGLAAGACSSASDLTAVEPDLDPVVLEDEIVEDEETIESEEVVESTSSEPESLPLVDDATTTTVDDTDEETTTTEPEDFEIVFSEEPDVTHVRVRTAGDTLNVRATPGVDGTIVGELAANTWYVQATGNVADLGDSLWREVNIPSGEMGWVNGGFVEQIAPTCTDITVTNPIESTTWDANLDGDGLVDVVNYVRLQDETMHIRVEFGNGATTATQIGVSTDVPFFEQGWVVAEDINGDGFEEIQFGSQFSGDESMQFISMDGCDFITAGVGFGRYASAAGVGFWNCTDFGTSDVMYWDAFRTVDGITTAEGFSFTPATGFTSTGQQVTLDDAQAQDFFELLCSNDYD